MLKKIWVISAFLCLATVNAWAELSSNPWLEVNDEEDLKEVYAKSQKRGNNSMADYTSVGATEIDRSGAYVELPKDDEEDQGFLGKFTSSFSKKEEQPLVTKTTAKRRAAAKAAAKQPEKNDFGGDLLSRFGLGNAGKSSGSQGDGVNNLIQKLERASGINLKAIGKQLRM